MASTRKPCAPMGPARNNMGPHGHVWLRQNLQMILCIFPLRFGWHTCLLGLHGCRAVALCAWKMIYTPYDYKIRHGRRLWSVRAAYNLKILMGPLAYNARLKLSMPHCRNYRNLQTLGTQFLHLNESHNDEKSRYVDRVSVHSVSVAMPLKLSNSQRTVVQSCKQWALIF